MKVVGFKLICNYLIISLLSINSVFAQTPHETWLQNLAYELSPSFGLGALAPKVELIHNLPEPAKNSGLVNETVIQIDTRLWERLQNKLGKQDTLAMVYVLAHELAHYFLHKKLDLSDKSSFAEKKALELHADELGCWAALSLSNRYAFDESVFMQLFQVIEISYDLNKAGYPSPAERLEAIKDKMSLIKQAQLANIFQAANFFYGFDKPNLATDCLKYIEYKGYRNELIINNLGVSHLRQLLASPSLQTEIFIYPIALATQSYSRDVMQAQEVEKMFTDAETIFRRAINLNPAFESPHINLAILYILRGRYQSAIEEIETTSGTNFSHSSPANLVKAIAYTYLGQTAVAESFFQIAVQAGSAVARYNYQIFKELNLNNQSLKTLLMNLDKATRQKIRQKAKEKAFISTPLPSQKNLDEFAHFEQISRINLEEIDINLQTISSRTLSNGKTEPNLQLGFLPQANGTFWQASYIVDNPNNPILIHIFQLSNKQSFQTSLGIAVGDSGKKVLEKYGQPDVINDDIYIYRAAKIMFDLKNNQVSTWSVFEVAEE
jgi:tetratricopeptide (TPR) repeat protein